MTAESKSNAADRDTKSFLHRSLRLYKNFPKLWKYTHNQRQKSIIGHVMGVIKRQTIVIDGTVTKK
ncbi:MAG: hypothetical protein HeimC2_31380 [Candidatus Heimdallarchaeota archaeon LC_2]|nr:MAG: hypothetical protein HeimC2_31380 [Candidatus Heimdallarchaeota archaeon LC_2]